jgi:prepilin-type N-terminal cleavage/methylation domain-containing protein
MVKALLERLSSIRGRKSDSVSGFTLIELLVSIIIASIIVGTLFGFLINILERDRTEQAKAEAQEEAQAALNFIADDMTEAVYIYDADGLYQTGAVGADGGNTVASQLPHSRLNSSRCNSTSNNCTPVLAFWKILKYDQGELVKGGSSPSPNRLVRCLDEAAQTDDPPLPPCIGGNKYTYSLVVYYLVKNNSISDPLSTWSSSSRIVRWELKDGIRWGCRDNSTVVALNDTDSCPIDADQLAVVRDSDQSITTRAICTAGVPCTEYSVLPDPGFRRFDLAGSGTLSDRMKRWRKSNLPYVLNAGGSPFTELIDFVDDTPYDSTQDDGSIGNSPADARVDINIIKNTTGSLTATAVPLVPSSNRSCDDPDTGVGVGLPAPQLGTAAQTDFAQRIPPDFGVAAVNPIGLSSFYACVNANRISARVFIRTNAKARLIDTPSLRKVSDGVFESFLPTASVRVFGRGVLSIQ